MDSCPKVTAMRIPMQDIDDHIHFNNAGSSPMPRSVLDKVQDVLMREHTIGGYAAQAEYSNELEEFYIKVGSLVNAANPTTEIAFVDSATTGWVRTFYSVILEPGDVVLSTALEYAANYVAILQQCKRTGAQLVVLKSDSCTGMTSLDDLRLKLQSHGKRVRVVSVTWIPTNGGIIDCAVEIGQMCKQYAPHAVYLLDACQAVGHICVDVEQLQCDVLTATGRKFLRGPRGTGFVYARESSLSKLGEPITIDHFAATLDPDGAGYTIPPSARRFEQWERNVAGMLGLGAAVDYLMKNVEINWAEQRIRSLAQDLRQRLTAVPTVTVRDLGTAANQCGIVTFTVGNVDANEVKASLLRQHVYVSVCPPASTPTDSSNRDLPALVRASLHCFNTAEESIRLCTLLFHIVGSDVLVDVPSGKSS